MTHRDDHEHPRLEREWTVGSAPGGATLFRQAGGGAAAGLLPEATFGWTMHADPRGAWHLIEATLTEALSTCYELRADVLAPGPFPELAALLGSRATLTLTRGARTRRVHGVIRELAELGATHARRARVRVTVVPELWLLAQRTDCRTFAHLTAVEIVRRALAAARLYTAAPPAAYLDPRHGPLRRAYTVQYQETDLAFVQRVLEDEGLTYYFDHDDAAAETLVIVDSALGASASVFPDVAADSLDAGVAGAPVPAVFALALRSEAALRDDETLHALEPRCALGATAVTLRDHDFTNTGRKLALTATAAAPAHDATRARYEYPGRYVLVDSRDARFGVPRAAHAAPDDGVPRNDTSSQQRFAATRLQEQQWPGQTWHGAGNVTGLAPGRAFGVADDARLDPARDAFVVVAATHTLHASETLGEPASLGMARYANTFTLLPRAVTYRPPRTTTRPTIAGPQTATVVGVPGEEIHTDAYGRVRVQFHWDRQHAADAPVSGPQPGLPTDPGPLCWVRCAQAWAGPQWGASFVPRVGMEVVVAFLDGDPDRPLIVGCVANSQNFSPFGLPSGATRNGLRTCSTPGGQGFNELSFEDAAGAEEIYLRAQHTLREAVGVHHELRVGETQVIDVGAARTDTVGGDETRRVGGRRDEDIGGDATARVRGSVTTTIAGDVHETIDGRAARRVQGDVSLSVDGALTTIVGNGAEPGDLVSVARRDHHAVAGQSAHVVGTESVVLRCGDATITLTPDTITLDAKRIVARGAEAISLVAHGPALHLTDEAELLGKTVRVLGPNARIEVADDVAIHGQAVRLSGPNGAQRRAQNPTTTDATVPLHLRVTDATFQPLTSKRYVLVVQGERHEGATDSDGFLIEQVPRDAQAADLTVWSGNYPEGDRLHWAIALRAALAPASDLQGAWVRLQNLGYDVGMMPTDVATPALRNALREFQGDLGLDVTGELDSPTCDRLATVHHS